MIERLEMISEEEYYLDDHGNIINNYQIARKPNNDEIIEKVNEIIDYLNNKELEE